MDGSSANLVRAEVNSHALHTCLPVNVQRAGRAQGLAAINAGRSELQMQIRRHCTDEERIHTRQAVGIVACGLPVCSEGFVGHVFPDPPAVRPAARREEQVVIYYVASHHGAPTFDEGAISVGVDDVVLDGVVAGIELDEQLRAPVALGEVFVEGIVDDDAVLGAAAPFGIPTEGDANLRVVIYKVVPDGDVTGAFSGPFAAQFDAEVGVVDDIALDDDVRTAVHVDAARAAVGAIGGISVCINVIHQVSEHPAIPGAVNRRVRVLAFEADEVNPDVVVVVDDVVRDGELLHVPVQGHGLPPAELAVVHLVAVNQDVVDGGIRVAAIDGNAVRAAVVAAVRDVVHRIVADLDEGASTLDPDAGRESRRGAARLQIADLEADHFDIGFILDDDQPRFTADGQAGAVDHGFVSRSLPQGDISAAGRARIMEGHLLFVHAGHHIDRAARPDPVHGVLDMPPGRRLASVVAVFAAGGDIKGAHQQVNGRECGCGGEDFVWSRSGLDVCTVHHPQAGEQDHDQHRNRDKFLVPKHVGSPF